jgi:iron complex outermembrane recepter protein
MKTKIRLILVISFILFAIARAQTIKVFDKKENFPLNYVVITGTEPQASGITNAKGEASFDPFKNSTAITFQLTGYKILTITYDSLKSIDFRVGLLKKDYTLGEVLVLGRNPSTELQKTLGKVELLGFNKLRRTNDMFLDRIINVVPGVKMETRSSTSQSHILIRGIGNKSRFGIRDIKVYYDGIPLTDADGTTSIDNIDFTSLGKLEIIKGSSSGIYGSSIGGTLNLFTKRAHYQEKDLNEIITFGSDGLMRSTFNFRAGTSKINFFTNYSYQNYDGYRTHSHSKKQFFTFGGDFFVSEAQTISLLANYAFINDEYPGEIDSLDFENDPKKANPVYISKNIGLHGKSFLLGVTNLYKITDDFENTTSIFTGEAFNESPIEPFFNRVNNNKVGARTIFSYNTFFGDNAATFSLGGEAVRNFNIERHYAISNDGIAGVINTDRELTLSSINLFLQGTIDFASKTSVTFSTGLNWSDYTSKDNLKVNDLDLSLSRKMGSYLTPGILLKQDLSDKINIYAQINTGFSPPTVSEISLSNGNVNSELNPERSINYEIGSVGDICDDQLHYEVSLFYLILFDSFVPQTDQTGFTKFVNAGRSDNKGAEVLLNYKLFEDKTGIISLVQPFITYSYNNFTYKEYTLSGIDYSGKELPGLSPNLFNAGLDITSATGLYLFVTYNFVDKRQLTDDNKFSTASYFIFDAKLGFRKRLANVFTLQVYCGVNNPTGENYSPIIAVNQKSLSDRGLPVYFNPAPKSNFYGAINFEYHF